MTPPRSTRNVPGTYGSWKRLLLRQALENGLLLPAGTTPRGPEVDHHHLVPVVLLGQGPAVQPLSLDRGHHGIRLSRVSFTRAEEGIAETLTEGASRRRMEEPACKPDSVPPKRWRPSIWGPRLRDPQDPRAHAAYPEASSGPLAPAVRSPRPECFLLGLAPSGVCRATTVARRAGELLPHRFTLACARRPSAVCSLRHFPRVAPPGSYPALCPTESGLSSTSLEAAAARPAPPQQV